MPAKKPVKFMSFLEADPEACLLLGSCGQILGSNPAAERLRQRAQCDTFEHLLPPNSLALIAACQHQNRAISGVEKRLAARSLVWSFIPVPESAQVLARGRDDTHTLRSLDEAVRANRLYRLITENTTDLISRHDQDGRFIDASPASWRLLGYWPEELRGKVLRDIVGTDTGHDQLEAARISLRDSGYATLTLMIRHKDGRQRWFEIASRAIRETYTGAVVEVVSVSRDITARINSEENNRRLAQVVEANTDLVLFMDQKESIHYMNPAARRALALKAAANRPALADFFDAGALARIRREGVPAAEQRGVWETETRLQLYRDTRTLPVSLVLLAHRAANGARYYSMVGRDMTERELREREQRRHQDELAQSARLATLGELASGIAHEMNQPLATIVNYASASQRYLSRVPTDPAHLAKVSDGLARINQHANHAAEVIKRLRAFLRKGQKRSAPTALNGIVVAAARLCQWEADKYQIALDLQLSTHDPTLMADPVLLQQVLINLIRNAMDANRERHGSAPSTITLTTVQSDQGETQISVTDQGAGLKAEDLRQMFTPFFTRKRDGLGLGLSMSRSIVEGFGGFLDATNMPQGGLQLTCRFPGPAHIPDRREMS
ncbi:PAS domain-containing sensor histidine kinase [Marinobacter sp. X15-166B]|uniref:PAS domain-containing sensor histidine kinase n=1 Tax=Marinobacter sp. X15-166B TaxID=1897620 RepID=UPI00085C28A5|nr:PAS domain S-box protein [Marinobacter sp. X15-166B]OEY66952.1 hypothetical protein BG841_11135 [Marinobacter sp. X15-166B]